MERAKVERMPVMAERVKTDKVEVLKVKMERVIVAISLLSKRTVVFL